MRRFCTAPRLPPAWEEYDVVVSVAMRVCGIGVPDCERVSPHDDFKEIALYGDCLGDRTLNYALVEIDAVTPAMIHRVQHDILRVFPNWRFRVCADDDEHHVVVYPDAVSIGDAMVADRLEERLRQWRREVSTAREVEERDERAQWEIVASRLSEKLSELDRASVVVVAAFDNWEGDRSQNVVWLLYAGPDAYAYLVERPEDSGHGSRFPVGENGRVVKRSWDDPPFWLAQWIVPDGGLRGLAVVRVSDGAEFEMPCRFDAYEMEKR
jgi:hypothetical protein